MTGRGAGTEHDRVAGAAGDRRARRMWRALEPLHAVTYFAPEPQEACRALGTKGYWMGYFGQRAAPLGAAPPEVVTALFYNFHPGLVARAVPDVWDVAPPERFLQVRLDAIDAALRRLLGDDVLASPEVEEAAATAREAALAAPTTGRALAAANAALPWPDRPHLVLWHAQTLLREQRGDGHVAALVAAGLDPVETLVLFAADLDLDSAWLRKRRGWSDEEWEAGRARLAERGLVEAAHDGQHGDGDGRRADAVLTDAGRALREDVERRTDAAADAPWAALGDERADRLVALAAPLVATVVGGDSFLPDNPMGLRPLVPAG